MKLVRRELWEEEERKKLELISEYVIGRKREREEGRLHRNEYVETGTATLTCNLAKRTKVRVTFSGKSKV